MDHDVEMCLLVNYSKDRRQLMHAVKLLEESKINLKEHFKVKDTLEVSITK